MGPSSWLHPASELHAFPAIRRTGCFSGDHTSQQVSQPPKGRVPSEEPGSWGQVGSRAWFHTRWSGFRWVGPTSRAWFSSEESCLCFAWLANSVPPPYGWDPLTNVRTGEFTVGRPGARSRHVTHQFGEWRAPRPPGSLLQGGRGPIPQLSRRPAGNQGMAWALSRPERDPGPRERLQGKPEAWLQRLLLPPWAPTMGPGSARPGPGSRQMNAFCRHQG